jgi:selenocysteine-specific elongation factor
VTAPRVIATAGHVDHGKTALVLALTGRDTDRLPAEKSRGISIELGFAPLDLPSGRRLSMIDVPGHERFVRHMVAGASGVDGHLLCVAADDGVMPQTREHVAVLGLLGVADGVVAVTNADLAAPERAAREARDLLGDGLEIVAVSAATGEGLGELRAALDRLAARLARRTAGGRPRLFVDRSFSIPGAGTVVTGTLWGEGIAAGDRVAALPGRAVARVRGVQAHERSLARAAGGRTALNLAGVAPAEVPRGACVVREGDGWEASGLLDVAITLLPDAGRRLRTRARLQAFLGTAEVPAACVLLEGDALEPGDRAYAQLRLGRPVPAAPGDRVVLRSAERRTVAGAVVIDAAPAQHGRGRRAAERLAARERGAPPPAVEEPAVRADPPREAAPPPGLDAVAAALAAAGLRPPAPRELAREAGVTPQEAAAALARLREEGRAVRAADLWFDATAAAGARERARQALASGPMGIGALRDLWGIGRRHAVALAAFLDASGLTRREGDVRVLRRGS